MTTKSALHNTLGDIPERYNESNNAKKSNRLNIFERVKSEAEMRKRKKSATRKEYNERSKSILFIKLSM